jgi:hypothetical protein
VLVIATTKARAYQAGGRPLATTTRALTRTAAAKPLAVPAIDFLLTAPRPHTAIVCLPKSPPKVSLAKSQLR